MAKKKKDKFELIHKLELQLKRDFPKPFCVFAGWQLVDLLCEYKYNPEYSPDINNYYINPVEFEGHIFTDRPDKIADPEGNISIDMVCAAQNYYHNFGDVNIIIYIYNDHFIRFDLDYQNIK